jgi:hypothetical protein
MNAPPNNKNPQREPKFREKDRVKVALSDMSLSGTILCRYHGMEDEGFLYLVRFTEPVLLKDYFVMNDDMGWKEENLVRI